MAVQRKPRVFPMGSIFRYTGFLEAPPCLSDYKRKRRSLPWKFVFDLFSNGGGGRGDEADLSGGFERLYVQGGEAAENEHCEGEDREQEHLSPGERRGIAGFGWIGDPCMF